MTLTGGCREPGEVNEGTKRRSHENQMVEKSLYGSLCGGDVDEPHGLF